MRSLWLASAAFIISTGIAVAQTVQTPTTAPASTGATTAPAVTPPGMSPDSMAPAPSGMAPSSSASAATPASIATPAPAPTGATNAPAVTQNGSSPGNTAQTPSSSMSSSTAMNTPSKPVHHWASSHSAKLPENASTETYLHIASMAIKHHNKAVADDALSHAETRLLTRSVPQGSIAADDSPSVQSIESARKALRSGDFATAASDTHQVQGTMHGM
jgi:hypothetical protein